MLFATEKSIIFSCLIVAFQFQFVLLKNVHRFYRMVPYIFIQENVC